MVRILSSALKVASIAVLAIIIAGGSVWFFNYWQDRERSESIGRPVTVEITDEDDSSSVSEKLTESELVRFGPYFEARMRFSGVELQPGLYTLRVGMSVPEIIDVITIAEESDDEEEAAEDNTQVQSFEVTFIEGQRIEQHAVALEEAGMPNASVDYVNAAADVDSWRSTYPFLESVPEGATLEGFLFPDTYRVGQGATVRDVIGLQLQQFEAQFTPEMIQQAQAQGLTIYEVVTLASIVEREAAVPAERPMISAVYQNRIESGMALNADPSNQYGVGTPEEWWPVLNTELLEQSKTTEYDTYENEGLPPGPIANPGFASLQAVLQPADMEHLYFVTKGDDSGEHVFSMTLEEHEQNTCIEHPDWEQCAGGFAPQERADAWRVAWMKPAA